MGFFFFLLLNLVIAEDLETILITNESESKTVHSLVSPFQIQEQDSTDISTQISAAPSLYQVQAGGAGGVHSTFLRGAPARHTLFSLEGVVLNDTSNTDGFYNAANLLTDPFDRTIINQGPSPVLYGAGAVSGIVELESSYQKRNKFYFELGSLNRQGAGVSVGGENFKTSYAHQKDKGLSRLNKERFNASEKDLSVTNQFFHSQRFNLGSKLKTKIFFLKNQNISEIDGFSADSESKVHNTQNVVSNKLSYQLTNEKKLHFRTSYNEHLRSIYQGSKSKFRGQSTQVETYLETKDFVFGSDFEHQWVSPSYSLKSKSFYQLSTFHPYSWFAWQLGGRFTNHSIYGDFFSYESSLNFYLPYEWTWYAKFAKGIKSPTLYQLYAPAYLGTPVGNEALDPEENRSTEFGLLKDKMGLSIYQQEFSNLIIYDFNNGYLNQDQLRIRGVSVFGKWQFLSHDLSGSADYLDYSKILIRRPVHLIKFKYGHHIKQGHRMGINFQKISSQKDNDPNQNRVKLHSYDVYGLEYSWFFSDTVFLVNIDNIFDQDYEQIYGYSSLPRNLRLSLTQTF